MFEKEETVVLDDGLPGKCFVTILRFIDDEEDTLMVKVRDQHQQIFIVSIYRLSKPF
jgi:hypothetical protein